MAKRGNMRLFGVEGRALEKADPAHTSMSEHDSEKSVLAQGGAAVAPSWKPLLWLVGGVAALVLLGELLFETLLEVGETLFLYLVEGPEEVLEDHLEAWLTQHYPHDADRYSEMITAFGVTPIKILTAVLLLRWLWTHTHTSLLPKSRAFLKRQSLAVWLAWKALPWYYKLLSVLALGAVAAIL
jgi:hypothetical protein